MWASLSVKPEDAGIKVRVKFSHMLSFKIPTYRDNEKKHEKSF